MHEYQITFFVRDASVSAHVASPLIRLAKKFKSIVHIINITKNRCAELNKSVSVFKVGLHVGDLCQITAIGVDAELACFVLKDIIAEYFVLVGTKTQYEFSDKMDDRLTVFSPSCEVNWHYAKAQTPLTQFECLSGLANMIYPSNTDELILAFIKREERSATCMFPGIALPHVMFKPIDCLTIAVITSDHSIDWSSNMGNVHLAIGLVLPEKPTKAQIITATNLTRNLLCEPVGERLLLTRNSADIQALLMYACGRLLV